MSEAKDLTIKEPPKRPACMHMEWRNLFPTPEDIHSYEPNCKIQKQ